MALFAFTKDSHFQSWFKKKKQHYHATYIKRLDFIVVIIQRQQDQNVGGEMG